MRGTSRREEGLAPIEAAAIEPALADPERPGTILDLVADVAVVYYLLGSAQGEGGLLGAIHGPRLERLMEHLVDTPVRGFVYEGAGAVGAPLLEPGTEIVHAASRTWRIPVAIVATEPNEPGRWSEEMANAALAMLPPAHDPK